MAYEFQITRFVEFSETDAAGIMHFSNFFRFMESVEHAFFRSLGLSLAQPRSGLELGLPRVHAECDYFLPLHVEDEVRVHLLVERIGQRSLTYQFRFRRVNGPNPGVVARGRVVAAFVARRPDGTLKSVPLPEVIAGKIAAAPSEILNDGADLPSRPSPQPKVANRAPSRMGSNHRASKTLLRPKRRTRQ